MRRLPILLCASVLVLPACHKADPTSIEDQIEILQESKSTKEKLKAVENLRKIGKREAVPGMVEALKDASPKVKDEIAVALGDLKDPAAVQGLVDAIDYSVGDGADRATSEINKANEKIARALGDIGDKAAVKPLMQLLKTTKNNYVRLEAIGALGRMKDAAAVPLLIDVATDDRYETLITKKALQALAQINHAEALPAFMQMAFTERRGVSFYPESAYGIFLLGPAAQDRVLALLQGKDKDLTSYAKEHNILPAALLAKAAQMECDLQDRRAVPALINLLRFNDADENVRLQVRAQAADALGRIRAREAVGPLTAMLREENEGARSVYMRALVQIGDPAALPKFIECSRQGNWNSREYCMIGVVHTGGAKETKVFDALMSEESGRFDKECNSGIYGDIDCKAVKAEQMKFRTDNLKMYRKALATVAACSEESCLAKALENPEPLVRERAAYELGRSNKASAMPILLDAIKRPVTDKVDLNPRFAAICAVDWLAASNPQAKAAARAAVGAIEAQVEQESQRMLTQVSAEELKRLAVKLAR